MKRILPKYVYEVLACMMALAFAFGAASQLAFTHGSWSVIFGAIMALICLIFSNKIKRYYAPTIVGVVLELARDSAFIRYDDKKGNSHVIKVKVAYYSANPEELDHKEVILFWDAREGWGSGYRLFRKEDV